MGPTQAHSTRTATRILALLVVIFLSIWMMSCGTSSNTTTTTPAPAPTPTPTPPPTGGGGSSSVAVTTETIVTGVSVPWSLVWAPDGRLFFTEQRGNLKIFNNGQVTTAYHVNTPGGLDGMTGLVLDPNFSTNHRLFVFYCVAGTPEHCMIDRLIENNGVATHDAFIFDFPTGNRDHIGGRMKIGPDGFLYLTTGDQQNNALSQDPSSPAGKILRMDFDGNAQGGGGFTNPFVFAMGFRDPEGLAWDASGNLYGSDHGPSSNDEINLIQAGKNYGWPTCIGRCNNPAFVDPVKLWTPETAAPSGMTFYTGTVIPQWTGSLFVASLGLADNTFAHHVDRLEINGSTVVNEESLFKDQFGRIRDVAQGPDGLLYFSSSNGIEMDVIVRIKPK
jgi:aldose sugar dehydrogenase